MSFDAFPSTASSFAVITHAKGGKGVIFNFRFLMFFRIRGTRHRGYGTQTRLCGDHSRQGRQGRKAPTPVGAQTRDALTRAYARMFNFSPHSRDTLSRGLSESANVEKCEGGFNV